MHRFFVANSVEREGVIELNDPAQIKQIVLVLRLSPGDRITLFDGTGVEHEIVLRSVAKGSVSGEIIETRRKEPFLRNIVVYMAMLKKDNFELVLQKATELGAAAIVPVITARCVKTAISANQQARYEAIVREATEQSGGVAVPQVGALTPLERAIDELPSDGVHLIASTHSTSQPLGAYVTANELSIFIGPEGGFTDDEVAYAVSHGCHAVTLGDRILRAETAAIASLSRLLLP